MQYIGEILSISVAFFWTVTALCFEYASKKTGAIPLNLIRLVMAFAMLAITLWLTIGSPIPLQAGYATWFWLAISGLIGFVFGDFCLFHAYIKIGSRFTQLLMTLAPPAAAIAGVVILNERLNGWSILGMVVTLSGIILSIVGRDEQQAGKFKLKIPLKGLLLAMGAGVGQGVGLVFSKLGMNHFHENLVSQNAGEASFYMIPFASSQIRIITGIIGFSILILLTKQHKQLIPAIQHGKAMGMAAIGTLFGPFIGVSLSLMAVQYTQAGVASTLMALSPIIILLPAYLIYKQKVTLMESIGAVISVIGVSLFFMG